MRRLELSDEEREERRKAQARERQRRRRTKLSDGPKVVVLCEAAIQKWGSFAVTRISRDGADNPLHRKAERAVIQPFRSIPPSCDP